MDNIATSLTGKHEPIDKPKRIDIQLYFTNEEFVKLTRGFIPQRMEDKWFIYYDEGWLYFHRSWTGFGIYKAQIFKEHDGYLIKDFWAERNFVKYQGGDCSDEYYFPELIADTLLGVDVRKIKSKNKINQDIDYLNKIKGAFFGVAIGDAVGVPFEFFSREEMSLKPAYDMIGHGTHNQPIGTWSDDSSLTFCLAEALANNGYDLTSISFNFHMWKNTAYWSARGEVFDIGVTTSIAISRLLAILDNEEDDELKMLKHQSFEDENGNGSLMRIMPMLFYIFGKPISQQFEMIWEVSALTHRHIRAAMSCLIYLKFAEKLLEGKGPNTSYLEMRKEIIEFWNNIDFSESESMHFKRLIQKDIRKVNIDDLNSGGYVIEVLESSIWFFLNSSSYRETILSIINIGHDTDTSAAIAGGLAGIYYGVEGIPQDWVSQIARKDDIEDLAKRFSDKILSN